MQPRHPVTRDLVLVGGGHAHALALRAWSMKPLAGVRLTLVTPQPTAVYSGMLPGFVAGAYRRDEIEIDLVRLARAAGGAIVFDRATGLDRVSRRLLLAERPPLDYDALSINCGAETPLPEGAERLETMLPIKPSERFLDGWEAFLAHGARRPRVAVIGAGVGGVETALAAQRRLRERDGHVTLIERGGAILPGLADATRRRLRAKLQEAGVTLRLGADVISASADALRLDDGEALPVDLGLWTIGVAAPAWLSRLGLRATADGFLEVDACLRSPGDTAVFVTGDAAHMVESPRPKAGVYAVRQAPALVENLRRALSGRPPRRFTPQSRMLRLINTSDGEAVADKWGVALGGRWAWRWKDAIDRKFMARLGSARPMAMTRDAPAAAASGLDEALRRDPLCGACGAKLGLGALAAAFERLSPEARVVFPEKLGDDAALLPRLSQGDRAISTDHLRAFTDDAHLHARATAIHALGDIWAMGARPEAGLLSVTLPPMAPEKHAARLAEILEGVAAAFAPEEATIIGGHSSEGLETVIGLTVIGRLGGDGVQSGAIAQDGAEPDSALILTKPLGVGVVLASEMRGAAPGATVRAAYAQMTQSSAEPARLLRAHGAGAMTDVTGFGLIGHLGRMIEASGVDAEVTLDAAPFIDGAVDLARAGVKSSLLPSNLAAAVDVDGQAFDRNDPRVGLLFDPQTAGGLLAAIPAEAASTVLDALRRFGARGWIIGRILPRRGGAARITLV